MSSVLSAPRYFLHDHAAAPENTNLLKTAHGRQDSASPEHSDRSAGAANMIDQLNPNAVPFRPLGGARSPPRPWDMPGGQHHNENLPGPPHFNAPPFPLPPNPQDPRGPPPFFAQYDAPPWAPPPYHAPPPLPHPNTPPPGFFYGNQNGFHERMPQEHPHPHPHPHGPPPPWAQFGPPNFHPQNRPYGPPPPMYPPHQQGPGQHHMPRHPPFPPQNHQGHAQPPYPPMHGARFPQDATNEELEYVYQALVELKNRKANFRGSAPASKKKNKKAKAAKAKTATQTETESMHEAQETAPAKGAKKGKYGDSKIMLPAPQPTELYLAQAAMEPSTTVNPPGHTLVILDLNGTVLFRPNKNPQAMIARPFLKPFLAYLFQNFKVMVWSSAKPNNVKALVDQALDKDLRSKLIGVWARDTFGLSATNYSQNVQVYKNLRLVWSRDQIQQYHPKYNDGERFGQHNTILIDDSVLKASAQPFNLLEIPEFEATPEQMEGDVLREVAGYLELARHQADVSKFFKREPFDNGRQYNYTWPPEQVLTSVDKVTNGTGKKSKPQTKNKNKNKPPALAPVSDIADSLSAVALGSLSAKEP